MILTCERCETRFRLDEKRLPAGGARVRCSRCKHAFFVNPGGAPAADVVHQLAEAAATQARMPVPAPSWDLEEDDPNGRTAQSALAPRPAVASDSVAGDFEEESDWRFEDEMQLGDSGASLDLPNGEAPALPNPDPNESSFAELGDPESWDLLSSPVLDPPLARTSPAPSVAMPAPQPIERAAPKLPVPQDASEPVRDGSAATRSAPALAVVPAFEFSPLVHAGAWLAMAVLVALATWATLVPVPPTATPQRGVVALGALELDSVRARQIENAVAGPIWVVSGALRNPSDEAHALGATLAVSLLDRAGAPIATADAALNTALSTRQLREEDPARLREEADAAASALAAKVLAPGASVAVDAYFAIPAREATRFAVEAQHARVSTRAVPAP